MVLSSYHRIVSHPIPLIIQNDEPRISISIGIDPSSPLAHQSDRHEQDSHPTIQSQKYRGVVSWQRHGYFLVVTSSSRSSSNNPIGIDNNNWRQPRIVIGSIGIRILYIVYDCTKPVFDSRVFDRRRELSQEEKAHF